MLITYLSMGLLQQNKGFPTPRAQANKMISRYLLVVIGSFFKDNLRNFFNNTQVFYPMYSMLYTVKLGLCDYVPFSQIWSHIV